MEKILFFDTEIQPESGKLLDIGAVRTDGMQLHTASAAALSDFAKGYPFVCGHNIIAHDLRFVHDSLPDQYLAIDTLCLSPLLFPMRPYHALVKDDKLQSGTLNNPLNDAMKARELFFDEYSAYRALPPGFAASTAPFLAAHRNSTASSAWWASGRLRTRSWPCGIFSRERSAPMRPWSF